VKYFSHTTRKVVFQKQKGKLLNTSIFLHKVYKGVCDFNFCEVNQNLLEKIKFELFSFKTKRKIT
jgi:hypothetical protein